MGTSEFGRRLRFFRDRAGLTQAQLADRLGVHELTVCRWETSETFQPRMSRLASIMDAIGVEPGLFWGMRIDA